MIKTDLERLVRCPHFCWLDGTKVSDDMPRGWEEVDPGNLFTGLRKGGHLCEDNRGYRVGGAHWNDIVYEGRGNHSGDELFRWLPDVEDSATKGCLLQLVREAWGDDFLCLAWNDYVGEWVVMRTRYVGSIPSHVVRGSGDTEAGALIAAILAAPEKADVQRQSF